MPTLTKSNFNKYLENFSDDIRYANMLSRVILDFHMPDSEKRPILLKGSNYNSTVFRLIAKAFFQEMILSVAKLFEERKNNLSLAMFLRKIQIDFRIFEGKESREELLKLIDNTVRIIEKEAYRIRRVLTYRDKLLAHHEPGIFISRETISITASLTMDDIVKLIQISEDIIRQIGALTSVEIKISSDWISEDYEDMLKRLVGE